MGKFFESAGVLGAILSVALGLLAYQEHLVHRQSRPEPQRITAANLGEKGPGDNIFVVVTEYEVGNNYVVEEKNGSWQKVWIPLFPPGQAGDLSQLKVLLRASGPDNEGELETLIASGGMKGLVTNNLVLWNERPGKLFTDAYPGVNCDKLWVLSDIERSSDWVPYSLWGATIVCVLFAVAGIVAFVLRRLAENEPTVAQGTADGGAGP